jgi:hypothetical protein
MLTFRRRPSTSSTIPRMIKLVLHKVGPAGSPPTVSAVSYP